MSKSKASILPLTASPVVSVTSQPLSNFKLPYRWLCLGLCGVLVTSLVVILTAWRPSHYMSLEDIISSPGEYTQACQRTDANEYAEAFADFAAVPVSLGKVLEIGCSTVGITDSLLTLQQRQLEDVSLALLSCDAECPRAQQGTVKLAENFFGSTDAYKINPIAYDDLAQYANAFDTVAGLYIVDRADNPYRMLWNLYHAMAPGATLVLYERVYTGDLGLLDRVRSSASLTASPTPSAVTTAIMEGFLAQLNVVFRHDMPEYPDANGHLYRDIAVVARKPVSAPLSAMDGLFSNVKLTATEPASDSTAVPTQQPKPTRKHRAAKTPISKQSLPEPATAEPKAMTALDQDSVVIEKKHVSTGPASARYFLIWTTGKDTFGKLRYAVLDRLFATVPHAEVYVYANLLPNDMFDDYLARNLSVTLVRYDEVHIFDGTPLARWASDMDKWRQGPYIYSHFTDAFRLCVLWKYGGIYIDFDVLVLRDLGNLRNSFGVEDEYGTESLQPWWWRIKPQAPSMNFAIAVFDRASPFVNYLMLQFHKVYDPKVWETVGPDLVTQGMRDWRNFHSDMVVELGSPMDATDAPKIWGTITIWTDPAVFYPVGWKWAIASTRESEFDDDVMSDIRDRAYTFHVYTQMFKFEGKPFGYEKGSILDHVMLETFY